MTEKILSQDEVDALLRGVVSGEVDTTPKEEEQGIRARLAGADFARPDADLRDDQRPFHPSTIGVLGFHPPQGG
ncbi:MAG: hypothetical protein C4293_20925 [Nitrospiraceae bacterium]